MKARANTPQALDQEPTLDIPDNATSEEAQQLVDAYVQKSIAHQNAQFEAWKAKLNDLQVEPLSPLHWRNKEWTVPLLILAIALSFVLMAVGQAIWSFAPVLAWLLWLGSDWIYQPAHNDKERTQRVWQAAISGLMIFALLFLYVAFNKKGFDLPIWIDAHIEKLFLTLVTAPVAFVLWRFRDQNQLWQIENNRKDINLKEFQKLSEQAAGLHYPEFKEGDQSYDQRRQNAETLQIAAIYQLKAYMEGTYGKNFMRPAFHLIKSIYDNYLKQEKNMLYGLISDLEHSNIKTKDSFLLKILETQHYIIDKLHSHLGKGLNFVLFGDHGYRLRFFEDEMHDMDWSGVNYNSTKLEILHWYNMKLLLTNFKGSNIKNVNFMNSRIVGSDFNCAILIGSNFFNADLYFCTFKFANLETANLENSNLTQSHFQGADLRGTKVNDATIFYSCILDSDTKFGIYEEISNSYILSDRVRAQWLHRGAIMVDDNGAPMVEYMEEQKAKYPREPFPLTHRAAASNT